MVTLILVLIALASIKNPMSVLSKWDERYLALAKEVSTWSKDPSTQVGAVTVGSKKEVLLRALMAFHATLRTRMNATTIEKLNTNSCARRDECNLQCYLFWHLA
ncbi:dCMP deaminase (EC [uncultured Gammaproteobacteria bacterium]|nr:dCMP deaminase (EC [uncultured Gammaproteobacteria bacterium]